MGDEDVVVDLLSADDIVTVVVDLFIGNFVVDLGVIVVIAENGTARVVVIVPIIGVANNEIMLEEYVTDDCVIFSVGDGSVTIVVVVTVFGCSEVVVVDVFINGVVPGDCLLYTSPSPRDRQKSRMPSSA